MSIGLRQRIAELEQSVIPAFEMWERALVEAQREIAADTTHTRQNLISVEKVLDQGVAHAVPAPEDAGLARRILHGAPGHDGMKDALGRAQKALANGWAEYETTIAAELLTTRNDVARAHAELKQLREQSRPSRG